MKLPESVKPVWRTARIVRTSKGLDDGLRLFILGPFFFGIFSRLMSSETALVYTAVIWAIYSGLIAFLEIPTGVIADVFGRVRAITAYFILNLVFGVGIAALVLFKSPSVILALAIVLFTIRAVAYTLFNGSFSAWVVDSIKEQDSNFGFERLLARSMAYYSWAMVIGGGLGIALYLHGVIYAAFITGALICLSCASFCLATMREPQSLHFLGVQRFWDDATTRMSATLATAIKLCRRLPVLWWLLITFSCYWFLLNSVSYLWPVVMGSQFGTGKWSMEWYGMVLILPMLSALTAQMVAWVGDRHHRVKGAKMTNNLLQCWMIGSCMLSGVAILMLGVGQHMGHIQFPLFAVSIMVLEGVSGIVEPCYTTLMHNYIPDGHSQERATVLSVGSMMYGLLMLVMMVPSSGHSAVANAAGWVLPSGIMLVVIGISSWKIRQYAQKKTAGDIMIVTNMGEGII